MSYDRQRLARVKRINSSVVSLSKSRIRSLNGNHLKSLGKNDNSTLFFSSTKPFLAYQIFDNAQLIILSL